MENGQALQHPVAYPGIAAPCQFTELTRVAADFEFAADLAVEALHPVLGLDAFEVQPADVAGDVEHGGVAERDAALRADVSAGGFGAQFLDGEVAALERGLHVAQLNGRVAEQTEINGAATGAGGVEFVTVGRLDADADAARLRALLRAFPHEAHLVHGDAFDLGAVGQKRGEEAGGLAS